MKQKFLKLGMGLFLSNMVLFGSAYAKTEIICNMVNSPMFNISIETQENIPNDGFERNKEYEAIVKIYGPRLDQVSNQKLIVNYIHTRVDVGVNYSLDLGNDYSILISDIFYNPNPSKTHFDGKYLENGQASLLKCTYKNQL
jgi:hypothetical protein